MVDYFTTLLGGLDDSRTVTSDTLANRPPANLNPGDIYRATDQTPTQVFVSDGDEWVELVIQVSAVGDGTVPVGRLTLDAYDPSDLPTASRAGDIYFDSHRGLPTWDDGDNYEWPNYVDDVRTSSTTVTNTTSRTKVWEPDINANSLIEGRIYQIDLHGTFQTASTSDNFTVDIDLAGTDVASLNNAAENAAANTPWTLELTFTVRADGASGTLKANTRATFNEQPRTANTAEITVDTTTASQLAVFLTWNNAKSGNSVTLEQAHLKQMA